jgi:hypothetical protein
MGLDCAPRASVACVCRHGDQPLFIAVYTVFSTCSVAGVFRLTVHKTRRLCVFVLRRPLGFRWGASCTLTVPRYTTLHSPHSTLAMHSTFSATTNASASLRSNCIGSAHRFGSRVACTA